MTKLLNAGAAAGTFPGGVASMAWRDTEGTRRYTTAAGGRLEKDGAPATKQTLYDLASVTKSVVATAVARRVAAKAMSYEALISDPSPDLSKGVLSEVTLARLLCHTSGLDAWGGLYLDTPHAPGSSAARRWILSEAGKRVGEGNTGAVYSDLGYMVVGAALEAESKDSLDAIVRREVLEPLGLSPAIHFPSILPQAERVTLAAKPSGVAPTERCGWRGRVLRYEVHDENCAALGGVAGHAGLFGDAESVARFGAAWLDAVAGDASFLPSRVVKQVFAPREGSHRLGWDTKSGAESAAGKRMSPQTFGHLGFTGTSLWCDPSRDLAIVLLTNRVHPTRNNTRIRGFRPAFYDALVHLLDDVRAA